MYSRQLFWPFKKIFYCHMHQTPFLALFMLRWSSGSTASRYGLHQLFVPDYEYCDAKIHHESSTSWGGMHNGGKKWTKWGVKLNHIKSSRWSESITKWEEMTLIIWYKWEDISNDIFEIKFHWFHSESRCLEKKRAIPIDDSKYRLHLLHHRYAIIQMKSIIGYIYQHIYPKRW
jgi:hypothetical protein